MRSLWNRRLIFFLTLIFILCPRASLSQAVEPKIGIVIAMTGSVSVTRGSGSAELAEKSEVFLSDTLLTGNPGKVQILLDDDTSITFGPNTTCEIREFVNEGKNSRFGANLGLGVMRVITGAITESNPNGFRITTPIATVGIRGTDATITSTPDTTIVSVAASSQGVVINGKTIQQSQNGIVTLSNPNYVQITERAEADDNLNDSLVIPLSGENAWSDGEGNELPNNGNNLSDATDDSQPKLPSDPNPGPAPGPDPTPPGPTPNPDPNPTPPSPTPGVASVSGNLGSSSFGQSFGKFGFSVDLRSGAITEGSLNGRGVSVGVGTTGVFTFSGGTGNADASGFTISGFNGSGVVIGPGGAVHLDPNASNMSGGSDLLTLPNGGAVPIGFELVDVTGGTAGTGVGTGTLTK